VLIACVAPPERNPNTINSNYTSKLKPLLQSFFPLFSGNIEECFSPKRESPTSIISNPGMTGKEAEGLVNNLACNVSCARENKALPYVAALSISEFFTKIVVVTELSRPEITLNNN
jgi:hypothetical protein